jgi:hypothetical protein
MAAEAAANPIPNADLRSILFIAVLPRLRNEPPQKRRAHFAVNGGAKPKKKGRSLKRACLPMALDDRFHETRVMELMI